MTVVRFLFHATLRRHDLGKVVSVKMAVLHRKRDVALQRVMVKAGCHASRGDYRTIVEDVGGMKGATK
jgi:hypothetical protein